MIYVEPRQRIHFSGIGGIGMSGLAEALYQWGYPVSGSDKTVSSITEHLETIGIPVQYGHHPHLVKNADLLVYSSAVPRKNPERLYAVQHGIAAIKRAELLGDISRPSFSICVAGTHGKTTVTALIAWILDVAGVDPTAFIGGIDVNRSSNVRIGASSTLVTEADEFDRSFLFLDPSIAVVTTVEADHLECYTDLEDVSTAFCHFLQRVPFFGATVACIDSDSVQAILRSCRVRTISCGFSTNAEFCCENIHRGSTGTSFDVVRQRRALGTIHIPLYGDHNVSNALIAITVCLKVGIGFETVSAACTSFRGVKRRFEYRGSAHGVTVIDDYAHHPTEIRATISAARDAGFSQVTAVFQPHLYSRTRDFLTDFVSALAQADRVIVMDIYAAREKPIPGVEASDIVRLLKESGYEQAIFTPHRDDIAHTLRKKLGDNEVILCMGAGDITDMIPRLLERLGHE